MIKAIIQQLWRNKWVRICTALLLVWFLYTLLHNVRYVTVTTDRKAQVAISHSLNEQQEIDEESPIQTTHTKLLWGYPVHILAQDEFSIARTTRESSFLSLNPFISVNLALKRQVASQKITSNGDQCVLYSNNQSKTLVTADCATNTNNTIYKISYGVDKKQLLDNLSVLEAAPFKGGFVYVSTLRDSADKRYELAFYNPETDSVGVIKTGVSKRPHIVIDDESGYGTGILIGSQYHTINPKYSLSRPLFSVSDIKDDTTYNDGLLMRKYGDRLAVFIGNSPYQSGEEGENSDRQLIKQTLTLYSSSGQELSKESVPKGLLVYFLSLDKTRAYITGKHPGGSTTLIVIEGKSAREIQGWGTINTTSGSLIRDEELFYIDDGRVWEYDIKLDSSHLVYAADSTFVNSINRAGDTLYVSSRSNRAGFIGDTFMYELNTTKSVPDGIRIESVLPVINWSQNLLFADVYLDNIIVNYQSNSAADPLTIALKNIGVPTKSYTIRVNDQKYLIKSSNQAGSTSLSTPLESTEHTEDDYFTGDGAPPEELGF